MAKRVSNKKGLGPGFINKNIIGDSLRRDKTVLININKNYW